MCIMAVKWLCICAYGRSLCSLVCKWLYEADSSKCGWNKEFLSNIGLADLAVDDFRKIGNVHYFQLYFLRCLKLLFLKVACICISGLPKFRDSMCLLHFMWGITKTMCIGHSRLSVSVCVSVPHCIPTLLHTPGCIFGAWQEVPPSCSLLGRFAIGAWVLLIWQHTHTYTIL